MKCPMCDGRRTMFTREQPGVGTQFGEIKLVVCPKCNGTGEVDENSRPILTNEEYIRSCSTEELAKLIYKIAVTDVLMDRFFTAEMVNAEIVNEHIGIKEAEAWLKEKHDEM